MAARRMCELYFPQTRHTFASKAGALRLVLLCKVVMLGRHPSLAKPCAPLQLGWRVVMNQTAAH